MLRSFGALERGGTIVLALVAGLAALALAGPAAAAWPGANGPVLVATSSAGSSTVQLIDPTTGAVTPGPGSLLEYGVSPDGTRVVGRALDANLALTTVRIDGSDRQLVGDGFGNGSSSGVRVVSASIFLPDGRIAFGGQPTNASAFNIYLVALDGSGLRPLLSTADGAGPIGTVYNLVPSPDGKTIYYADQAAGGDTAQLFAVDVASGQRTQLTTIEGPRRRVNLGDVSPDGTLLVYTEQVNNEQNTTERIYPHALKVLDLATRTSRTIPVSASLPGGPRFSPDGRSILFGGFSEQFQIGPLPPTPLMVIGLDGTGERPIFTVPASTGVNDLRWLHTAANVSGEVIVRDCGEKTCTREGLPGATVTATRAGGGSVVGSTGDDGRYALALEPGAWTVTPTLRDAVFEPASRTIEVAGAPVTNVDFETCGPTPENDARAPAGNGGETESECGIDFIVDAVEIVQRVQAQRWFAGGSSNSGAYALGATGHDRATLLVKGVSTIVKVYVQLSPGAGVVSGKDVPDGRAYAIVGGRRIPLGLLSRPTRLRAGVSIQSRRANLRDTYVYVVPTNVLDAGAFNVLGEVRPTRKQECVRLNGVSCATNNAWTLTGVKAVTTNPFVVTVFGTRYRAQGPNGPVVKQSSREDGAKQLESLGGYLPLRPGDLRAALGPVVDVTGAVKWAQGQVGLPANGVLVDCVYVEACTNPFSDAAIVDLRQALPTPAPAHPWLRLPLSIPAGVQGATTDASNVARPLISWTDSGSLTIVHELLHQAGLKHAGDSSGCRRTPSTNNTTWPNNTASIVGVGVDPVFRWATLLPNERHDVMGYCAEFPIDAWISNLHWNTLVETWRAKGGKVAKRRTAGAAAGPRLRVTAALSATGGEPYVAVSSTAEAATPSDPAGTIAVTAYDASGAVVAQLRTADLAPEGAGSVSIVLPVPSVARLELVRDGGVPSAIAASPTAPTVALTSLRGTTTVGPKRALVVGWTMADGDPGALLDAHLEYSTDDGRTWSWLAGVGDSTSYRIPAGTLTRAAKGRLRVVVSDGLQQAVAVSGRLRVAGAPPRVTLVTGGTLKAAVRAPVTLSGHAFDETGAPLTGRRLRWLDGAKVLGRGERVTVRFATKGTRTIRLVATDRAGRSATRTLRVRVR
ncbi:MAG: hypothetical protein R3C15_21680 [Thermoleophilia bacterium]